MEGNTDFSGKTKMPGTEVNGKVSDFRPRLHIPNFPCFAWSCVYRGMQNLYQIGNCLYLPRQNECQSEIDFKKGSDDDGAKTINTICSYLFNIAGKI